ncbi:MAG: Bax inhibitor-1/YccA family protein [Planctomycetales bacterium]|nr:Bax inhibitor-1/YccA family protein [Planctomycetales bacterium]
MRSGNPALNDSTFNSFRDGSYESSNAMTISGAATKTMILLGLCFGAAAMTWGMVAGQNMQGAVPWMIGGVVAGLIFGLATSFKPTWAPVTAPLYALAEGLFLGGLSAMYEAQFHGIVFQALLATFGTTFSLLIAYQFGIIKATENFKLGVFAATGGIAMMYLAMMLMSMFGMNVSIMSMGWLGIGISVVVVIVAAMNLVLDFDYIEQAAQNGAPKYCEWYAAYGLMVTLVWLYVEILRLIAMLAGRSRND